MSLTKTQAQILQSYIETGKAPVIADDQPAAGLLKRNQENSLRKLREKKFLVTNKPPHNNEVISGDGLNALSIYKNTQSA